MERLKISYNIGKSIEAGIDEAGRGCLAGPVFAAAVIFDKETFPPHLQTQLQDSKKLSASRRNVLRQQIVSYAADYAVDKADNVEVDKINILNASFLAMHRAVNALKLKPDLLLVDGNRFKPLANFTHKCIIKGDGLFLSIAAASILAKTYRDDFMCEMHNQYPQYGWLKNKGYPTREHRRAIASHGLSPLHRRSFGGAIQLGMEL